MTRTASIVPQTHDELFRLYYPLVKGLVVKHKIPFEFHEDVAMTLLTKFIEKGMLDQYDPDFEGKSVQFTTFLSGFVVAYLRGINDRIYRDFDRERLYVDQPVQQPQEGSVAAMPWLDSHGFSHEDDLSNIEYDMLVHGIRKYLAKRRVHGKKNFLLLFDFVLDQLEEHGRIYIRELAGLFDVSESLMSKWLKELSTLVRRVHEA